MEYSISVRANLCNIWPLLTGDTVTFSLLRTRSLLLDKTCSVPCREGDPMVVDTASCCVGVSEETDLGEVVVCSLRDKKLRRGSPFRYTCKISRTDYK